MQLVLGIGRNADGIKTTVNVNAAAGVDLMRNKGS